MSLSSEKASEPGARRNALRRNTLRRNIFTPGYWLKLLLFTLFCLYAVYSVGLAGYMANASIHPAQRALGTDTPADWGLDYEAVTLQAQDGIRLKGWYISPSSATAAKDGAVILLHGYAGTRLSNTLYAQMLARHGYSVLTYDQRATGESEGKTLTWGWLDAHDVAAAVDYLQTRAEINPQHIGVLGCSTGAEVAITGAALDPRIAAIVADAPYYVTAGDVNPRDLETWLGMPMYFIFIQWMEWKSGVQPSISLEQAAPKLAPRPLLLISSGKDFEKWQSEHFYHLAGEPKEHWNIPDVPHCGGAKLKPQEYEAKMVQFFDNAFK